MANRDIEYRLVIKDDGTPVLKRVGSELDAAGKKAATVGNASDESFKRAKRAIDDASGSAGNFHRAIERLNRTIVAFIGVWAFREILSGFEKLISAGIEYNATLESSRLGIASIMIAQGRFVDEQGKALSGVDSLNEAQRQSLGITKQLQIDNLKTAATYEQLVKAYQQALAPGLEVGLTFDQIRQYSLGMVQAASAMGINLDMMAEEMRSMLKGTITPKNTLIATYLGIRPEDIAKYKGDAEGLFQFIMGRLQGFTVAGEAVQNTFAGIWSNTKDAANIALGQGFEPLFDYLKEELKKVQGMFIEFNENGPQVKPEVLKAFQDFSQVAVTVLETIKETVEYFASWKPFVMFIWNILKFIAWTMTPIVEGAKLVGDSINAWAGLLNRCFDILNKISEKLKNKTIMDFIRAHLELEKTVPKTVSETLGGRTGVPVDYSGQPDKRFSYVPNPKTGLTEDEERRLEKWLSIQRELTAELDKTSEEASRWSRQLTDVNRKYEDVIAKSKGMKGLPVDKAWMDRWKEGMIANITSDWERTVSAMNAKAEEADKKLLYDKRVMYLRSAHEIFNIEQDNIERINRLHVESGAMTDEEALIRERDLKIQNLTFEQKMIDLQLEYMGGQAGVFTTEKEQLKLYQDKLKIQAQINATNDYTNAQLSQSARFEIERQTAVTSYQARIAEIKGNWEQVKETELRLFELETQRAIVAGKLNGEAKKAALELLELKRQEIRAEEDLNMVKLAGIGLNQSIVATSNDLVSQYKNVIPNAVSTLTDSFSSMITNFATGVTSIKDSWNEFFKDLSEGFLKLAMDIAMTIVKLQIMKTIAEAFPSLGLGVGNVVGGRESGGPVEANKIYKVNEKGIPEVLSVGNTSFLLMGNRGGHVSAPSGTPFAYSGVYSGGAGGAPIINVYNNNGSDVKVNTKKGNSGIEIDVLIDNIVGNKMSTFGTHSNKSLKRTFGTEEALVNR